MNLPSSLLLATLAVSAYSATPPSRQPTPLASLLREADQANPAIRAARRAWQAARQVPRRVSALPDPQFQFATMSVGGPLPLTGSPDQMMGFAGVGVAETFPFPGKLRLRGQMAARAADTAGSRLRAVQRRVRAGVRAAYARIGGDQETLAVLHRDLQLLRAVERITEARYSVGQGTEADVLQAQLQSTRLLAEITVQRRDRDIAEAALMRWLNRPQSGPPIVAAPPAETPLPALPALAAGVAASPEYQAQRLRAARAGLGVRLARRDFYPDLHVGYMYDATGPSYPYRSSFSVGISIPLFWRRKQDAALVQAVQTQGAAQDAAAAVGQRLSATAREWYLQAQADSRLLALYQGGLLPQSAATWQATLAAYQAGGADFRTLIDAFLEYDNLQQEYWRTRTERTVALAHLRQIIGPVPSPTGVTP